jgi:hypothetical protein
VKDKLPTPGKTVIVHGGIAYYREGDWYTLTGCVWPGKHIQWPVEWWMPLPDPPVTP